MRIARFLLLMGVACFTVVLPAFSPAHAQTPGQTPDQTPGQPLGADRVSDAASLTPRAALAGHRPAWAVPAADRGQIPDTQRIELLFALTRAPEVQAAFEQLLADQQNPSSPRFHQWLTPQQAGAQFGPTQHDLDALTTWLTGQGIRVDGITPSRIFVQASVPAAIVSAAFGTSLHTYQVAYGADGSASETMQAPTSEPTLPAALAPLVAYIGGLTSVPVHTHSHMELHQTATPTAGATLQPGILHPDFLHPDYDTSSGAHYLAPLDFNKIYDVPASPTATGQKVMIVGGSRLDPADVANFESIAALAPYTPNYLVDPAYADPGQTMDGNQGEATLDFERVYATAAGAQVDLVIAANWLNGTVNQNLILYAINTVNDPVLSLSFGACENLQPTGYVKQEDAMYSQAAAQGITTLASAGDAGVTGCATHDAAPTAQYAFANINDICASSFVTCVGGTQFNDIANPSAYWAPTNGPGKQSALGYIPEGAWNEPVNTGTNAATVPYLLAATGGGPSTIIAKPAWQTGTGVPSDGVRDTPDISFAAAQHDGYFSCLAFAGASCVAAANGTFIEIFSGTSASAPSMAGVAALLDARLGGRQGNLNPTLYKLAASTPAAFHDVTPATSGVGTCSTATPSLCNNSTSAAATLTGGVAGYPLQTGYDLVTGLGSLDVNAFLNAAAGPAAIATISALTAAPATITSGQSAVFTLTVTAATVTPSGPEGFVTFTNATTGSLGNFILSNGANSTTATISTAATAFPTAGTYSITAVYTGTTAYSSSSSTLSFVVTAPLLPATTTTLSGTTGTITAQTGASYTATVAPAAASTLAPTGNVQFLRTSLATGQAANLGAAVPVTAGKATLTPTVVPVGSYSISAVYTGDPNFAGSTSNSLPLTSTAVATTTTLLGLPATVTSTTSSSVSITVLSSTGSGTPTGTVQLSVDTVKSGAPLALGLAANGIASAGPVGLVLATGTHSVCALYSGDTTFAASTSVCSTVVATTTPVAIALSPATASIYSYQTTPVVAIITGISAAVLPTSTVTFKDGSTTLATVTPTYSGSTGTYTYAAGPLSAGIHTLTATFNGDATYSPATSNVSTVTVTLATVTLTPASTTLSIAAGTSSTDVITLTSLNFAGTENLSCTVAFGGSGSAGTLPGCSLAPATATFNGSGTASSTLTITSLKRASPAGANFSSNRVLTLRGMGGLTLCALFALWIPARTRKAFRRLQALAAAALLTLSLAALSGCGGNNFNGGGPPPGAAAGPYTVTITASGSTNVSGSTTVSLSIQ